MAFPWVIHETFDDGTRGNFDAETDASSILDFPDYKELARQGLAPWQGGHALRVRTSSTATANIDETGYSLSANTTNHLWMPVLIAEDFTLADGDEVIIAAFQQGATNEAVVTIDRSGDDYRLGCGETGTTRSLIIQRSNSVWHQVEVTVHLDAGGGGDDGTLDFYIDGAQVGAQITGLTQGALDGLQIGAVSGTSASSTGTFLIGGIIVDDARVYPRERFPRDTFWVTRDVAAFIGSGCIDSASVTGTSTDAVMTILDADIYSSTGTNFSREPIVYARNVTANDQSPGFNPPVEFSKGVYVQLTGTNPQAWISVKRGGIIKSHQTYVHFGRLR